MLVLWIILLVIAVLVIVWFARHSKRINTGNVTMITGGVKCGKTTLAVAMALKDYEPRYKAWKRRDTLCKLFHRKNSEEMPIFYSNIPVIVKCGNKEIGYCKLTRELVERKKRFNYNSIILISESSMFADSMYTKDAVFNERLKLFCKLIAHETHGGKIYFESQSMSDNHYSIKRCLDKTIYSNGCHKVPFLPLIKFDVRERTYSYDTGMAVTEQEILDTDKWLWLSTKWWKRFDTYCYSGLTDDLERITEIVKVDTLKTNDILNIGGTKK